MSRGADDLVFSSQESVFSAARAQAQHEDPNATSHENDLLARLRDWFRVQDVTWCGTPGELGSAVGVSADELVRLIESNSSALERVGIHAFVTTNSCRLRQVVVSHTERPNAEHQCESTIVTSAGVEETPPETAAGDLDSATAPYSGTLMSSALVEADPVACWRLRVLSLVTTALVLAAAFVFFAGRGVIPIRFTHVLGPPTGAAKRASPDNIPVPQNPVAAQPPQTAAETDFDVLSFPALLAAARSGNLEAQHLVGLKYLHGDGVETNSAIAADWLYRAALRGHSRAQYDLASNYAAGAGRPADLLAAYTWFVIAYANGDARGEDAFRAIAKRLSLSDIAQIRFNIGEMYARGIGVQPDPVAAYMWYRLAEVAGERRAQGAEAALATNMTDDDISLARSRAAEWITKHRNAK
jgi:uncharacterized protein